MEKFSNSNLLPLFDQFSESNINLLLNDVLRILVLAETTDNIKTIKQSIFEKIPRCIFIVATSLEAFHKKVKWMNSDIAIVDMSGENSLVEEVVSFLKQNNPLLPIIHLDKKNIESRMDRNSFLDGQLYSISLKDLTELPTHIQSVLKSNESDRKLKLIKENLYFESKTMIFKSLLLLEQSEDFDQKKKISDYLEILQENMNLHELLKI